MSDTKGRGGKLRTPALTRRQRRGDSLPVPQAPSRATATRTTRAHALAKQAATVAAHESASEQPKQSNRTVEAVAVVETTPAGDAPTQDMAEAMAAAAPANAADEADADLALGLTQAADQPHAPPSSAASSGQDDQIGQGGRRGNSDTLPRLALVDAPPDTPVPPFTAEHAPHAEEGAGKTQVAGAAEPWPEPTAHDATPARPIRRPRTLGDVVQPGRPPVAHSQPRPSGPLASAAGVSGVSGTFSARGAASLREPVAASSSGRHITTEADVAALDLAVAQALDDHAVDEHTLDEDDATTEQVPVVGGAAPVAEANAGTSAATSHAANAANAERSGVTTKPIAAMGPFMAQIARRERKLRQASADEDTADTDDDAPDDDAFRRFLRAARRGTPRVLWSTMMAHVILGLALALVASTLLLVEHPLGGWLLVLAGVALASAGLTYGLLAWRVGARFAPLALVAGHVGTLAWLWLLLGPQPALLVLLAPVVVLDLRAGGRWAALTCGIGTLALYIGIQVAAVRGLLPPALTLAADIQIVLDTGAVVLGVVSLLLGIIAVGDGRERSDAAARARLYEVRLQRGQVIRLRGELEHDGQMLDEALVRALRGRGLDPISLDGPLSVVAEDINAVAERLRTLQKDREDRLRLEGAIRALTRVLERARVSLPWNWPEPSDTLLDEVVALLRAPRAPIQPVQAYARTAADSWATPASTSAPHGTLGTSGSYGTSPAPAAQPAPAPVPSWPPTIDAFPGAGLREPVEEPPSPGINVRDLLDEW